MVLWIPIIAVIAAVVGSVSTVGCVVFGVQNHKHNAEAKAADHWNKNSCNAVFSTASGGSQFHGYSYEAKGDGLDCKDLPKRSVIEKEVKSCVQKFSRDSIASGCCDKTMGKAHWQIRVSRNKKRYPVDKVTC